MARDLADKEAVGGERDEREDNWGVARLCIGSMWLQQRKNTKGCKQLHIGNG